MFLQENLLHIFKLHLHLQGLFGTINFNFKTGTKDNPEFVTCSPQMLTRIKIKFFFHVLLTIILWIQIFEDKTKFPLITILESTIYSGFSNAFLLVRWVYIKRQLETTELFQLLFQFERQHLLGKLTCQINFLQKYFSQLFLYFYFSANQNGKSSLIHMGKLEKMLI